MTIAIDNTEFHPNGRKMTAARELTQDELLWRAVLAQAIRDIYSGDAKERSDVLHWLKTKDFEIVCEYAQVETTSMMEQIASLITMPTMLARKYGKLLRDHVMHGIHSDA